VLRASLINGVAFYVIAATMEHAGITTFSREYFIILGMAALAVINSAFTPK
jgi:hypothetical protein